MEIILKLSKITSKGQITLPAEIRRTLGVRAGDTILFEKRNGDIVIKKTGTSSLVSILEGAGPFSEVTNETLKNIRDEWH